MSLVRSVPFAIWQYVSAKVSAAAECNAAVEPEAQERGCSGGGGEEEQSQGK